MKSKLWLVEVSEIIHHAVLYTVEAQTIDEAREKAELGDTVKEKLLRIHGVMERHVESDPEPMQEKRKVQP